MTEPTSTGKTMTGPSPIEQSVAQQITPPNPLQISHRESVSPSHGSQSNSAPSASGCCELHIGAGTEDRGVFTVTIWYSDPGIGTASGGESGVTTQELILWDRKRDGGFPEVKVLKSLVRNVIAPERDLGHTDRALRKNKEEVDKNKQEIRGREEEL
ncbi:uncharacterized protein N7477_004070 [Penicillium maclennaniae]|uniref:uncharacterized protein n=1 Tax=Penicillium maclennaniae TaxID=1343394 RepID=UPI00254252C4|nr:uncharacterized protein N7477_004070 [Penicillium maclennaniae]KAJ5678437.1 hypothetical protein N7477_004070 [Penicillium maclennaniae]